MNERFPDDPRVLTLHIWGEKARQSDGPDDSDDSDEIIPPKESDVEMQVNYLDDLIRRFPKENWLRANRLGLTLNYAGRIDRDATEADPRKSKSQLKVLRGAISCAQEAAKLEPDNGYFPYIEAILRFCQGQNEAGLKALEKASHASRFNNYYGDGIRQRLAVFSLDHPLLFEEKLEISIGQWAYSSSTVSMSDVFRTAIELGVNAQKSGNNQKALQIYDSVLATISLMRHSADNTIVTLIGSSMGHETLKKSNEARGTHVLNTNNMTYEERAVYYLTMAKEFEQYASRYGREDVARRATNIIQMEPSTFPEWYSNYWDTFGLKSPWSRVALQGNWFAVLMARLAFGFGLVWLVSRGLFSWFSRKKGETVDITGPNRGQVTLSTNFSLWAMMGYLALAAYFGVGFMLGSVGWVQSLDMATNQFVNETLTKAPLAIALATWILPVLALVLTRDWGWTPPALTKSSTPLPFNRRENGIRIGLWCAAVGVSILAYTNGRGLWDDTLFQWFTSPILAAFCGLLAIGYEIYRASRLKKLELGHLKRQVLPNRWLFIGKLLSSSAGALAVIWSLFFLMGAFTLWPLRATLNQAIERRIEVGEVRWMNEQFGPESKSSGNR